MRNMSFALTTEQVRECRKFVTRRLGWTNLKFNETLRAVKKSQGLKKGEKVEVLDYIFVTDVRREPLNRLLSDRVYGYQELLKEGFPSLTVTEFVEMFCRTHKGCTPETEVTRIEFEYAAPERFPREEKR